MTTPINIVGAGMAGLLAAEIFRGESVTVTDAQASLPDNHGALLRFRSDAVARETKQDFQRVVVTKGVKVRREVRNVATITAINQYAHKVSGTIAERSIMNLDPVARYIAPDDFLARLAGNKKIYFNEPWTANDFKSLSRASPPVISTVPMPMMMKLVGWDVPEDAFQWRAIYSVTGTLTRIPVNVFQTIYYPDPALPFYRASITGNRLIIEYLTDIPPDLGWVGKVLEDFGIPLAARGVDNLGYKRQSYGKLVRADEAMRREFILAMTDQYNLYSVGRFATWRQILLDDVVQDIHLVRRMIMERSHYTRHLRAFSK